MPSFVFATSILRNQQPTAESTFQTDYYCFIFRNTVKHYISNVSCYKHPKQTETTSYLCHHCHKVGGSGLVIQSLTRFDSQDPTVAINGKLGKRGGLLMFKTT